jgi:hypothetical protein
VPDDPVPDDPVPDGRVLDAARAGWVAPGGGAMLAAG